MTTGPNDLDIDRAREAGLERATTAGATHAEVRVETIRSQYLSMRDSDVESTGDDVETGLSVRVVYDGAIGFAATVEIGPSAATRLVDEAIASARATARARGRRVELAPEPSYGRVEWHSPYVVDPTEIPLREKVAFFKALSEPVLAEEGVDHVFARVATTREEKYYADLNGTVTDQHRVRLHAAVEALAVADDGSFETMRTIAPPVGRGWEHLEGDGYDFTGEVSALATQLREKVESPSVEPGQYDLVIDPSNLWLTIHESIGHATELDRALGYEAAYAGTSFATIDKLGVLQYGSPIMNVTGDRTARHGLATIGWDDEGVEAQSFDIVRDGMLVGYQLDRSIAAEAGFERSNGCAYASSPLFIPIQRMANVSLAPSKTDDASTGMLIAEVERGIFIVGDKSWSIDMQRYNFQFTGQRFYRIENGEIVGQLRDVAYQATTTEFWGSMTRLGGPSTYVLGGAVNCGKGQPGQSAPVSHGCPSALFRNVAVLNARAESGQ
ncbi:MAG TPA: TldD/PmbA family protein [Acidimicrobiales bacterium]|jgi:TldD protein|nr:TldD/PmbA family protein [Acidimicrobiales bacterium]